MDLFIYALALCVVSVLLQLQEEMVVFLRYVAFMSKVSHNFGGQIVPYLASENRLKLSLLRALSWIVLGCYVGYVSYEGGCAVDVICGRLSFFLPLRYIKEPHHSYIIYRLCYK